MGLLNSFQLGSGMDYPSAPSSLGTGMLYLNPADTPDPSIPKVPLGYGMFGTEIGAPKPEQPNMMGLLGLGKSMLDASQQKMPAPQMPMMAHNSGPISFLPQSGITMPYNSGSPNLQALLQQMQNNPFGR